VTPPLRPGLLSNRCADGVARRLSLQAMAGPTIRFLGQLDDDALAREYTAARAGLYRQRRRGLVPLEAMASGRPVLAYRAGGATEVVVSGETGAFFEDQEPASMIATLRTFQPETFSPAALRAHAERYDRPRFRAPVGGFVSRLLEEASRNGASVSPS
jgi:glycosyltransferase involved in cell wall biosynthesis